MPNKGRENCMEILKVSSKSNPNLVAGALAAVLRESSHAELQAVGAGAVNQAVKAIAITRSFIADEGLDLICVPSFSDVNIDGVGKTAIRIAVSSSAAPTGDIGVSKE